MKATKNTFWTSQRKAFDRKLHGSHAFIVLLGNWGSLDLAFKYTRVVRSMLPHHVRVDGSVCGMREPTHGELKRKP